MFYSLSRRHSVGLRKRTSAQIQIVIVHVILLSFRDILQVGSTDGNEPKQDERGDNIAAAVGLHCSALRLLAQKVSI